jgi:ABC-type multidrug transport system fused ATPase/permease subunit
MQTEIAIVGAAFGFLIIFVTSLLSKTPIGYLELDSELIVDHRLGKLRGFTRILNFLLFGVLVLLWGLWSGYVTGIEKYLGGISNLSSLALLDLVPSMINGCSVLTLFYFCDRLNHPAHAYSGGQYAIFLSTLLQLGTTIASLTWEILPGAIAGILVVQLLIYGFWSFRSEHDDIGQVSFEQGACIFSQLFYVWMTPMVRNRDIQQNDMWELVDADRATSVLKYYYSKTNDSQSLGYKIWLINYPYILYQLTCTVIDCLLSFAGPFFLYHIVSRLQIPGYEKKELLVWLLGMLSCGVLRAVVFGQIYFTGRRVGNRTRVVLIDELYRKSLHRVQGSGNEEDGEQASLGKIVTLMSVDTERVRTWLSYCHDCTIQMPISITISIVSLYFVLGWPALVGIALICVLGPVSTWLGKIVVKYQDAALEYTDNRVSIMNELLQGIRIVKYFGWENHFAQKVLAARKKELHAMFKIWGAYIGFGAIGSGSGIIVIFTTFAIYTMVAGKTLDAATAFTAVNLLKVVSDLLAYLPTEIMNLFKAKVSLDRISKFLEEEEIDRYAMKSDVLSDTDSELTSEDPMCGFKNAEFKYYGNGEGEESDFTLRDINIQFQFGKLNIITGPTGSGKTSLLLALLGGIFDLTIRDEKY